MPQATDPQTPQEWQEAVDAARVLLLLDSARQYGFVTGGPRVDVERCEQLLARGRELGYEPADDALERALQTPKLVVGAHVRHRGSGWAGPVVSIMYGEQTFVTVKPIHPRPKSAGDSWDGWNPITVRDDELELVEA